MVVVGSSLWSLTGCDSAGGGGGGDGAAACAAAGEACSNDADCCDGLACGQDGTCAEGAEGEGEGEGEGEPEEFLNADVVRGGAMYDKWWVVAGADEPTEDHPFWALQDTNERSGNDTWRCKECHGWDYKGVGGAYATGSHMTGFAGIFGTAMGAQEVFDLIKDGHGLGNAGLTDDDVWDLARFVLQGQIDTDDIIDETNAFTGDVANGETLYNDGVGTNAACTLCHGADGKTLDFGEGEFLGTLANGNPWETQHKIRFGHPGTAMPATAAIDATLEDVADVGAFSQTLPVE